jgi:predicted nucleic acid-binding protein
MRILDTVALVSFIEQEHPLHARSEEHIKQITTTEEVYVPSVTLQELDLVMKGRGFTFEERQQIFAELLKVIPVEKVLRSSPSLHRKAAEFDKIATWNTHYFDVLVAAFAFEYKAEIITTDTKIGSLGVTTTW